MSLHVHHTLAHPKIAMAWPDFLAGGGASGEAMRAVDWRATPLGAPESWPEALRTCLRILLASRVPMLVWWGPRLIQFHNDASLSVPGLDGHAMGQPASIVWADAWARLQDCVARMQGGESGPDADDGVVARGWRLSFSPVPEQAGRIGGIVCTLSNESPAGAERLALEAAHRRRAERHQDRLVDELNHRVKNTLATVQAMAMQTLKGSDRQAREAFLSRLFALSGQHDLLTLDNWEGASFDGVVRRALRPWQADGKARFQVEGPPVRLEPKRALALGMGFHELATNAAQYGALSNETGHVCVTWKVESGGMLRLRWEERGGPPVVPPPRRGFGLRLIEQGLGRELSGVVAMDFAPDGLVCEWVMKLH